MNCYENLPEGHSVLPAQAVHAGREAQHQALSALGDNSKRELDRRLDQGLEETFLASDPVSVLICV
jgi:hypothetical protein